MTTQKRSSLVAVLTVALLIALTASSAAAAPLVQQSHSTFSDAFPDNICGIDGTSVLHVMDNIQVFADGTFKDESRFSNVFTSAATGKSIEIFGASQFRSGVPIVNGDGTVTYANTVKGLPEKVKIPNGPILLRDAGTVTFLVTFDANGNFISTTIAGLKGPHPITTGDFTRFCDVIVPALT